MQSPSNPSDCTVPSASVRTSIEPDYVMVVLRQKQLRKFKTVPYRQACVIFITIFRITCRGRRTDSVPGRY